MREIKFRAWDNIENEWLEPPVIDGENGLALGFSMLDGEFRRHFRKDEVIVSQYTGLKDKNGTEIYEGDILSTDLSRPYLIVEFRNGAFMFQCHDNGNDYYDFMTSADEDSNFTKYHEVIGNIYEHLLEGK